MVQRDHRLKKCVMPGVFHTVAARNQHTVEVPYVLEETELLK